MVLVYLERFPLLSGRCGGPQIAFKTPGLLLIVGLLVDSFVLVEFIRLLVLRASRSSCVSRRHGTRYDS